MEGNPMKWLENKVVFITGAGEGIGKAVVNRFLDEGAAGIVAFDRALSPLIWSKNAWPP
jgi:NAD(P)-dependent dehydrogenase (short-subunit alcohol dehydrogenase family)